MLILKRIYKKYNKNSKINALNNINLIFRNNEFVSILGPSGSGKTTLLNIIGGMDKYNKGNLLINNKSTKNFDDKLWDYYRNNVIGFIFQDYNLIEHISILKNVEISLTLSNMNYKKRKKIAKEALKKVGLEKYINKKPNSLSGGQMQRVAIARAIVNNPNIILADEPTGALDSKTSEEIMKLIKNISKNKLVIMVTHNIYLANKYSTRIINLKDGKIINDSNPVKEKLTYNKINIKKTKMSFLSALYLSLNNLNTKRNRTILTSFASSIGIIGIALILSISNGFKKQINNYEKSTLSKFPIVITKNKVNSIKKGKSNKVGVIDYEKEMYGTNQIDDKLIEYLEKIDDKYLNTIIYDRNLKLNLISNINDIYKVSSDINLVELPNESYLNNNYKILKGRLPLNENELVLILDNNKIDKKILDFLSIDTDKINLDNIINMDFKLINNNTFYNIENNKIFTINKIDKKLYDDKDNKRLIITGIIKEKENDLNILQDGFIGSNKSSFGYLKTLSNSYVLNNKDSIIVDKIKSNNDIIVEGKAFYDKDDLLSSLGYNLIPNNIYIYPKDYNSKKLIINYLNEYNTKNKSKIIYSDYSKEILSLSNNLISAITTVLISFSSISLIVSSIMISIITYISVLERTKEIGILRSLGARKKDIIRLFSCENFIIGLLSGLIGIIVTLMILKPINVMLYNYTDIKSLAILNSKHSILLITISTILCLISGFIPSKIASKKDIVKSLKS